MQIVTLIVLVIYIPTISFQAKKYLFQSLFEIYDGYKGKMTIFAGARASKEEGTPIIDEAVANIECKNNQADQCEALRIAFAAQVIYVQLKSEKGKST